MDKSTSKFWTYIERAIARLGLIYFTLYLLTGIECSERVRSEGIADADGRALLRVVKDDETFWQPLKVPKICESGRS